MKIYYQEGDLLLFDDCMCIVCANEMCLYYKSILHFKPLFSVLHEYSSVYYRRIVHTLDIHVICQSLINLCKDIPIQSFLETQLQVSLKDNIGNALIYYVYAQANVIHSPVELIREPHFFTNLSLKNNMLMKHIYLNI